MPGGAGATLRQKQYYLICADFRGSKGTCTFPSSPGTRYGCLTCACLPVHGLFLVSPASSHVRSPAPGQSWCLTHQLRFPPPTRAWDQGLVMSRWFHRPDLRPLPGEAPRNTEGAGTGGGRSAVRAGAMKTKARKPPGRPLVTQDSLTARDKALFEPALKLEGERWVRMEATAVRRAGTAMVLTGSPAGPSHSHTSALWGPKWFPFPSYRAGEPAPKRRDACTPRGLEDW